MARGRAWTLEEDDLIRAAAEQNRRPGGYTADDQDGAHALAHSDGGGRRYAARLADVARQINRTPDAVRKRAQRIHAESKQPAYFGKRRASPKRSPAPARERIRPAVGPSEPWNVEDWLSGGK